MMHVGPVCMILRALGLARLMMECVCRNVAVAPLIVPVFLSVTVVSLGKVVLSLLLTT